MLLYRLGGAAGGRSAWRWGSKNAASCSGPTTSSFEAKPMNNIKRAAMSAVIVSALASQTLPSSGPSGKHHSTGIPKAKRARNKARRKQARKSRRANR